MSVTDDQSDPTKAHVAFESALSSGVIGIFGGTNSIAWTPIVPLAKSAGMLLNITALEDSENFPPPALSIPQQHQRHRDWEPDYYVHQELSDSEGLGPAEPDGCRSRLREPGNGVALRPLPSGRQKAGVEIVSHQTFPITSTDEMAQAAAIAHAKPSVVIFDGLDSNASLVVHSLTAQGYTGPVVTQSGPVAPSTLQAVNNPKYFALRPFPSPVSTSIPAVAQMVQEAKATDNTTTLSSGSTWFTTGYASAVAAVQALQHCPATCSRSAYENAWANLGPVTNALGLNPSMAFTPSQHSAVVDGQFWYYSGGRSIRPEATYPVCPSHDAGVSRMTRGCASYKRQTT